jgi:hypothetical protein
MPLTANVAQKHADTLASMLLLLSMPVLLQSIYQVTFTPLTCNPMLLAQLYVQLTRIGEQQQC